MFPKLCWSSVRIKNGTIFFINKLEFKLAKNIGTYKHAGKVRKYKWQLTAKREQKSCAAHKKGTSRLLRTSSNAHSLLGVFISCCIPATTQTAHFCNIYSTFLQYFIMLLVAIFRLRKLVNLFFCRSSSVIWMVGRTSTLFLSPLISFGPWIFLSFIPKNHAFQP